LMTAPNNVGGYLPSIRTFDGPAITRLAVRLSIRTFR
jgi:hypothetical protein